MQVVIRGLGFRAYLVGSIVVPNPEILFIRVDMLHVNPISLSISLLDLFRNHFTLLMEVILVLVIALVKAVVNL